MTGPQAFVNQADSYVKARPSYPASLFEKLASLTRQHERAWDVGTGNGQAAVSVAEHYKHVVATDISQPQISLAMQCPNVTYSQMSATPSTEELELIVGPKGSVDLVVVACALHWFDVDSFYPIVKHILRRPGGVFAAWSYSTFRVSPEVDKVFGQWYADAEAYKLPGAEIFRQQYRSISFPFEPVPGVPVGKAIEGNPEELEVEKLMTVDDFFNLLKSLSLVENALNRGVDILGKDVREAIFEAWGSEETRTVTFPIFLLMGTISPASAD